MSDVVSITPTAFVFLGRFPGTNMQAGLAGEQRPTLFFQSVMLRYWMQDLVVTPAYIRLCYKQQLRDPFQYYYAAMTTQIYNNLPSPKHNPLFRTSKKKFNPVKVISAFRMSRSLLQPWIRSSLALFSTRKMLYQQLQIQSVCTHPSHCIFCVHTHCSIQILIKDV